MDSRKQKNFNVSSGGRKGAKEVLVRFVLMLCSVYTIYSFFYPAEMNWQSAKKEKMGKPALEIARLNLQAEDHQGMITMLTYQSLCNPF
jgi:hypothetical protein